MQLQVLMQCDRLIGKWHACPGSDQDEKEGDGTWTDGDTDGESMASELRPGWSEKLGCPLAPCQVRVCERRGIIALALVPVLQRNSGMLMMSPESLRSSNCRLYHSSTDLFRRVVFIGSDHGRLTSPSYQRSKAGRFPSACDLSFPSFSHPHSSSPSVRTP